LPWFARRKDFAGQALGGWKISLTTKLVAGTPFTLINGAGLGDLNFDGFSETRPVVLNPSVLGRKLNHPNTSVAQIPREAFRPARPEDFGCCIIGRNTFTIDGVNNTDLSFFKTFALPFEKHSLVFRADLFNAFNQVQFGFPATDIAQANFGRITSTAVTHSPRNVQFSLRYVF
jgi:hypothetical protein